MKCIYNMYLHGEALKLRLLLHALDVVDCETNLHVHEDDGHDYEEHDKCHVRQLRVGQLQRRVREHVLELKLAYHHHRRLDQSVYRVGERHLTHFKDLIGCESI